MIVIRFSTQKSWQSWLIRTFENGFWASHVSAELPDGRIISAQLDGGVLIRPADSEDICTRIERVELPATEAQTKAFHKFLLDQRGARYDWRAIVAFAFVRDWRNPNAWFCSELILAALIECGWFSSPLIVGENHVMPRDLALVLSSHLNLVWKAIRRDLGMGG